MFHKGLHPAAISWWHIFNGLLKSLAEFPLFLAPSHILDLSLTQKLVDSLTSHTFRVEVLRWKPQDWNQPKTLHYAERTIYQLSPTNQSILYNQRIVLFQSQNSPRSRNVSSFWRGSQYSRGGRSLKEIIPSHKGERTLAKPPQIIPTSAQRKPLYRDDGYWSCERESHLRKATRVTMAFWGLIPYRSILFLFFQ